jgi:hypothetical protein
MDLLGGGGGGGWGGGGGGGGGVRIPLARAGGGAIFYDHKQKIIRDKMRHSNLSNNMMIR